MFPKPFDNWGKHVNCYPRLVPIIKRKTRMIVLMFNMHDIAAYLMYIFLYSKFLSLYIDDIIYNVYIYIYVYMINIYVSPVSAWLPSLHTRNLQNPNPANPRLPNRSITRRHLVALPRPSCHGGHPGVPGQRGTGGDGHEIATWHPKQPVFQMDGNGDFQPLFMSWFGIIIQLKQPFF